MSQQFSLFGDDLEPVPPGTVPDPELPVLPGLEVLNAPAEPELTPEEKAARLEEVREPALVCTRCDLARTRTHVAFGEGNPNAPLVLIGEGPGENEDATGRPFVGRAGKLLDDVLRRNGMNRNHVYICNVIKCRAADPEGGRLKNRPPTAEEIEACNPWLRAQLGIIRPLVAVCVGAPAANTIIHKGFRMTGERGTWFTTSAYAPWTMAVFHPAYVLRLHGPAYDAALETLVEDLGRARQKVIEVRRQLREAREATEGGGT
jgi:DNA polymerase